MSTAEDLVVRIPCFTWRVFDSTSRALQTEQSQLEASNLARQSMSRHCISL